MPKTLTIKGHLHQVELGEVCQKISVGLAISVTPHMREEGTKLIRNQNIRPNRFSDNSIVYVDNDFAKSQRSKRVRAGDVISVRTGSNIGDTCVVPDSFDGALTFTTLIARPNKNLLDSRYLSQYMNSELGRSEVNRLMAGGGKGNLNAGELKKYLISLPSLEEQREIAEILATWDEAIALTERAIEARKKLKKSLLAKLFKPQRFHQKRLHDIAEIQTGIAKGKKVAKNSTELPYLRVANVQDGHLDLSEIKTILLPQEHVKRYSLQNGDILLTEGGDYDKLGRGTIWHGQIEPCVHQNHIFAVRTNSLVLLPEFFSYQIASPYGKKYFLSCAKQTTNLASVNSTQLKNFPVLVPSLEEQRRVIQILNACDQEIIKTTALLSLYQQQKQGLMQKLLTGQWRVSVQEAA